MSLFSAHHNRNDVEAEPDAGQSWNLAFLLAIVSVLALSLVGIGALTGLLPTAGFQRADGKGMGLAAIPAAKRHAVDAALAGSELVAHPAGVPTCPTCGVVESIRTVQVVGDASAIRRTEKGPGKRLAYRVTVRMDDGSYRTLSHASMPQVAIGDRVRIVDGAVVRA